MLQDNVSVMIKDENIYKISNPVGNNMFKVNQRNSEARCEICSALTKIPERRHWRLSVFFNASFEHISNLVLVFLLLTWSR